jgi:RNA polymerase sigma factor (sigma-70 family)
MSGEVVALRRRLTADEQADVVRARSEVRRLAAKLIATHPRLFRASRVTHQQLIAEGDLELSHAMTRLDARRGVPLSLYARKAVYGAMVDLLKGETSLQKALREGAEKAADAQGPRREGGEPDTWDEEAEACAADLATGMALSLAAVDPERLAMTREHHGLVRAAVSEEPPQEQALIEQHYLGDHTLEEAGSALGMSLSTTKRRHRAALRRISARLRLLQIDDA